MYPINIIQHNILRIYNGCGPLTGTVTTKIITCLIGNPYKPSFTTVTVRGPHPRYNIYIHVILCIQLALPIGHEPTWVSPVPLMQEKLAGMQQREQKILLCT